MDARRKKELKDAYKVAAAADEATIRAMRAESYPAPFGSFAAAREFARGQARSDWLQRHAPALHAGRARRLFVVAPAPTRHGVTGYSYFRCKGCGSVAPSRPKRNRLYWWSCECGNVRLRRFRKWGRVQVRDESILEPVHIMGRGAPATLPFEFVRRAIRRRITGIFNDADRGERPVLRRADALFPPDSVAWKVNGDVTTMMIGGVSGLLLQMLHPAVLAGVWDHSDFRSDMHGRLRRTAKFIATTTYDHAEAGRAAIDRVNRIHARLGGVLPDGTPYQVSSPALLAWVHVTETISFLDAWIYYAEPDMPRAEEDAYFEEMARIGEAMGADPLPRSRAEAEALIQGFRPLLKADERTHEVAAMVMRQTLGMPIVDLAAGVIMQAGMDLLPDWAKAMHRKPRGLPIPLVRGGAETTAQLLRWAFDGSPNRRVHPDEVTRY